MIRLCILFFMLGITSTSAYAITATCTIWCGLKGVEHQMAQPLLRQITESGDCSSDPQLGANVSLPGFQVTINGYPKYYKYYVGNAICTGTNMYEKNDHSYVNANIDTAVENVCRQCYAGAPIGRALKNAVAKCEKEEAHGPGPEHTVVKGIFHYIGLKECIATSTSKDETR